MTIRLGDLLVRRGVITTAQRETILDTQLKCHRPFGVLAEELFGVNPTHVEQAWAEQYASYAQRIDPRLEPISDATLALIDRRQAWQFGIIPIRVLTGELLCVSCPEFLARAMRFTGWRLDLPCSFAMCDRDALLIALGVHYQIDGLDRTFIDRVMTDFVEAC